MPSSRPDVISPVLKHIMKINPNSILDVGSGFGKWGFLLREYLEVWQGRLYPHEWQKQIDAIEIWTDYTDLPWYHSVYNNVFVGNVLDYVGLFSAYDLVLFLDVIEHLEKDQSQSLLKEARHWVMTTPAYVNKQGAAFGNPYEAHKSFWKLADFENAELIARKMIFAWR